MADAACGHQPKGSKCVCVLAADEEHSIHECDCGGAWEATLNTFVPWVMPGGPSGIAHLIALARGWKPGT